MICFLTSRLNHPETEALNPANRMIIELRSCFPAECRALYICSDPDGWDKMDLYAGATRSYFEKEGLLFRSFAVLDGRNENEAMSLVHDSDMVILAGGHVPTQNRFFRKIRLRELLADYSGVVIGISAGSMNAADIVYSQPEEEGEALDHSYQRFLPGLGLTKTNLLPHYQEVKDDVLDGMRIFEDIAFPDSFGNEFYAIPDGSYLYIENGREELRGEAYRIRDGVIEKVSDEGGSLVL